ncbi:MAG: ATP-binding protein [Lachnospiraceae bacterium]|nr:ATP-binding protein [Lachnospiraceae bacterium]
MIGRKQEIKKIEELYNDGKAEFIAVYGRRRVGKTYLIDEVLKGKITFRHAGLSPVEISNGTKAPLRAQLEAFYYSLLVHGMKKSHCPKDWLEAFFMLETFLQSIDDGSRIVVFLDELPWMDTAKSGFITAFEGFWNSWGCHRNNLMVVVCGSANSWIMDKLINNHGGLYGRITHEIKLEPFNLSECEACITERNVNFSRYDIVQAYMIFGGIPYYLNYLNRGLSLAQNVDSLFFSKKAVLRIEYDRLFASVFKSPEAVKKIVEFLATRNTGYTRKEISAKVGISNGGDLTKLLFSLEVSDFIVRYIPFKGKKNDERYRLIDPFCLFYLKFVKNSDSLSEDFWLSNISSQNIVSWRGFAFENVCFNHISEIKNVLGIRGVSTKHSAWFMHEEKGDGHQIDLIIERNDNVVNMCEIKFYGDEFSVDRSYDLILRNRRSILESNVLRKCAVHSTLITTYGLKDNEYKWDFENVITMDDLFG